MEEFIQKLLIEYRARLGRAPRFAVVNMGGTVLCLRNAEGQLEPVKDKEQTLDILLKGSSFQDYLTDDTGAQLLELSLIHHDPKDSSQILDRHRAPILDVLFDNYEYFDGFLITHGTDTAVETARFLHLSLPYTHPESYLQGNVTHKPNWLKPVILVSSQKPAAEIRDGKLQPKAGSDGDVSLITGFAALAQGGLGEVGVLTNGYDVIPCATAQKSTEKFLGRVYTIDQGINPIATRTAEDIIFADSGFIGFRPRARTYVPEVIRGAERYQKMVLEVVTPAQLVFIERYLDAVREGKSEVVEFLRPSLPKVILYGSKGSGNVVEEHDDVLKKIQEHDVLVMKVPLPGGRVPDHMIYAVPGGDIEGVNMEQTTARYKAQVILAFLESKSITNPTERRDAFYKLMKSPFANEMLPKS